MLGLGLHTSATLSGDEQQLDGAIVAFGTAAKLWSAAGNAAASIRADINLAITLKIRGKAPDDLDQSRKILEQLQAEIAVTTLPDGPRVRLALANTLCGLAQTRPDPALYDQAISLYAKAREVLESTPNAECGFILNDVLQALSETYRDTARFEEAINVLKIRLRRLPEDHRISRVRATQELAGAYYLRAQTAVEDNQSTETDFEAAEADFERATEYYDTAINLIPPEWAPSIWARATADFGISLGDFSSRQLTRHPDSNRSLWMSHLQAAVKYLESCLRFLPPREKDQVKEAYVEISIRLRAETIKILESTGTNSTRNPYYGMDDRIFRMASYIRAELIAADIPIAEWRDLFALVADEVGVHIQAAPSSSEALDAQKLPLRAAAIRRQKPKLVSTKCPRPHLPDGLTWPKGDYGDSPEAKREVKGGIIAYITRVWLPILAVNRRDNCFYVDRRIIDDWYPGVTAAISNYERFNKSTGEQRRIPEHLRFPILKQVNDHALSREMIPNRDLARLARAAKRRGLIG